MIKNLSGQEFADFEAWKEWAEECVNPLMVEFLTFYPWIITEKDGAQPSEEFSKKLDEQFIRAYSSDALLSNYKCKDLEPLGYIWYEYFYNFLAMKLLLKFVSTKCAKKQALEFILIPLLPKRIMTKN